jgi:hypothetical protein
MGNLSINRRIILKWYESMNWFQQASWYSGGNLLTVMKAVVNERR